MRVILPSGEVLTVPSGLGNVAQLKAYIDETISIPASTQLLFLEGQELEDSRSLADLPESIDADLLIGIGQSYCICRSDLPDRLELNHEEVLVTRASRLSRRDAAELVAPPALKLGTVLDKPAQKEVEAKPFLDAFYQRRGARLMQLRRIRSNLHEGPVMVSTFNWGFRDLIANWVASCDRHKIDCRSFALVFPTDERSATFAQKLGLRVYYDGQSYGKQSEEGSKVIGDRHFRHMMFAKIAMTVDMLEVADDFIRQDVDLIWHKDPRADLARRASQDGLDMLFMYDGPNPLYQPQHYNSGFIYIRANDFTVHAWKTVLSNYGWVLAEGGEQRLINSVVNLLRERGLRTARLPETIYVNGHMISAALKSGPELPGDSAVVHVSWTADRPTKIEHMKQFGLWYL